MAMKKMVILGLGQRGTKYAEYAVGHPGEFSLAAIIENDPRRAEAGKKVFQGVPFFRITGNFSKRKYRPTSSRWLRRTKIIKNMRLR